MLYKGEYECCRCGHDFDKIPGMDGETYCPRCGSHSVEGNPYLFRTGSAEALTPEDYFSVALKP